MVASKDVAPFPWRTLGIPWVKTMVFRRLPRLITMPGTEISSLSLGVCALVVLVLKVGSGDAPKKQLGKCTEWLQRTSGFIVVIFHLIHHQSSEALAFAMCFASSIFTKVAPRGEPFTTFDRSLPIEAVHGEVTTACVAQFEPLCIVWCIVWKKDLGCWVISLFLGIGSKWLTSQKWRLVTDQVVEFWDSVFWWLDSRSYHVMNWLLQLISPEGRQTKRCPCDFQCAKSDGPLLNDRRVHSWSSDLEF